MEARLILLRVWFAAPGFAPRSRYFARYAKRLAQSADDQKLIAAGKAAPAFLERDWTLNDFPSSSRR